MSDKLTIKLAQNDDLSILYDISAQMHGVKEREYFERSLHLQAQGERDVLIAYVDQEPIGYVMLSYRPKYGYYRAHEMPEIQDLNVLPDYRRRGYGAQMIAYCEDRAREKGYSKMGIGVGLTPSYGPAQRLYARLGYIPDGMGVTYDRKVIAHGAFHPFDDEVSLMMEKEI